MKILMTAIALVIAVPAAAQTAPAQPEQGHDQDRQHGQGHDQHGQHQPGQHQSGHGDEGGCCADRNGNGRMDCCENMEQSGDRRGGCPERDQPAAQPQGDHSR